jgi:hypothetical protein
MFQREFVWSRVQVRELLDSIGRNYPIGSVLLWQSRQPLASERTIAGLSIGERPPDYPVNYLLDGQQRLSTICGALFWRPAGDGSDADSIWNLAYDLNREEFIHLQTLSENVNQIPLRTLSDAAQFFRRVSVLEDDHRARAEALFNRFQDYMIAAVTLGDMPLDAVGPVFERINSTGTPLTMVDLMRAATWSTEFDLRESIDDTLAVLTTKGYGAVDRRTLLRAISAVAGLGYSTEDVDRLRELNVDELSALAERTKEAARRAVDFLVTHIRAPSSAALPYMNQIAVLIDIFSRVDAPAEAQYRAIERWFWRSTLGGYFGGWNTGQMSSDMAAVASFASGADEIELSAAVPRADVWRTKQFRSNSAISKMLALLLSYRDPVDLLTGQRIDVGKALSWANDKEFHHLFPRDYLKTAGVAAGRANAVANIVMLTSRSNITISNRAPSDYLSELVAAVGEDTVVERLATALVPRECFEAAMADDYPEFLEARASAIHDEAIRLLGDSPSGGLEEGEQAEQSDDPLSDEASVDDDVLPEEI